VEAIPKVARENGKKRGAGIGKAGSEHAFGTVEEGMAEVVEGVKIKNFLDRENKSSSESKTDEEKNRGG